MQFVHDILDISAMDFPEKDAIITSEHSINYGRLRKKHESSYLFEINRSGQGR